MAFIYLENGWCDESTEGMYVEYFMRKGKFTISRCSKHCRNNDLFQVEHENTLILETNTLQEGIDYIDAMS